ncbi:hypothetical protein [Agrococcus citreus]
MATIGIIMPVVRSAAKTVGRAVVVVMPSVSRLGSRDVKQRRPRL